MKKSELIDLAYDIMDDGEDGFMPLLVNEIQVILGKGNYIYDMWEFGPDHFSLFWWIRKAVCHQKIELIEKWIVYNQLEDMVDFQHKKENVKQGS